MLDYFPNADHAGLYAAPRVGRVPQGRASTSGSQAPSDPAAPLKLLAAGKVDLAISYEPELLLARDKGLDLVAGRRARAEAADLDHRPRAARHRASRPTSKGKTVGTAGIPYQSAYLKHDPRAARASTRDVSSRSTSASTSCRRCSPSRSTPTLGAFWNYEGVQLEQRKRKPTIIRMERVGVPTYNELVLVARAPTLGADRGALVRRFLQALGPRHEALRSATRARRSRALLEANRDLERSSSAAVISATLPVFFPADTPALRLAGPARVAGLRPTGWSTTGWSSGVPSPPGADQRVPAGQGI